MEDAYREETKDEHRVFLFVGKNAIKGLGTMGYGNTIQLVPGTGTTIEGIISPTSSYYPPLNAYNGTYIEYQVGEGTSVLAVGDGKIIEVDDVGATGSSSKGKYVVQEVNLPDGKIMQVTYGNLKEVSVSAGSTVSSGDLIGKTGKNQNGVASLYFSVTIDGKNVDPSTIFYQSNWVYGAGSLGQNLNNADGSINKEALKQLREELNLIVGLQPNSQKHNPYSPSDFNPAGKMPYLCQPMNTLTPLQCTWWAAWPRIAVCDDLLPRTGNGCSVQTVQLGQRWRGLLQCPGSWHLWYWHNAQAKLPSQYGQQQQLWTCCLCGGCRLCQ